MKLIEQQLDRFCDWLGEMRPRERLALMKRLLLIAVLVSLVTLIVSLASTQRPIRDSWVVVVIAMSWTVTLISWAFVWGAYNHYLNAVPQDLEHV